MDYEMAYNTLSPEHRRLVDEALNKKFGRMASEGAAAITTFFFFGIATIFFTAILGIEETIRDFIMIIGGTIAGIGAYIYCAWKWKIYYRAQGEISELVLKSGNIRCASNN